MVQPAQAHWQPAHQGRRAGRGEVCTAVQTLRKQPAVEVVLGMFVAWARPVMQLVIVCYDGSLHFRMQKDREWAPGPERVRASVQRAALLSACMRLLQRAAAGWFLLELHT